MNERIQKLIEQAYERQPVIVADPVTFEPIHKIGNYNEPMYHNVFNPEKFAELLIRECVDILSQNNPCPPGSTIMYSLIQDEYFDKGWQVAVETKSNQIKKHFGVKE